MSDEISQPGVLRPETERLLANLLDNPDGDGQDLYARQATEPGEPDVARDSAAP